LPVQENTVLVVVVLEAVSGHPLPLLILSGLCLVVTVSFRNTLA
jgi:hypothetical protein